MKKLFLGMLSIVMVSSLVACGESDSIDKYLSSATEGIKSNNYEVSSTFNMMYEQDDLSEMPTTIDLSANTKGIYINKDQDIDYGYTMDATVKSFAGSFKYTREMEGHENLLWNKKDKEYKSNSYSKTVTEYEGEKPTEDIDYLDNNESVDEDDVSGFNEVLIEAIQEASNEGEVKTLSDVKDIDKQEAVGYEITADSKFFMDELFEGMDLAHAIGITHAYVYYEIPTFKKEKVTMKVYFYEESGYLAKIEFTDMVDAYNIAVEDYLKKKDNWLEIDMEAESIEYSIEFTNYGNVKSIDKYKLSDVLDKDDIDYYSPSKDGEDGKIVSGEFDSYKFKLNSVDYAFPLTLKDFLDNGYEVDDTYEDIKSINVNGYAALTLSKPKKDGEYSMDSITVGVTNASDDKVKSNDGSLRIDSIILGSFGEDFELPGGLKNTTTEEELKDIYKEYSTFSKYESMTTYTYQTSEYDYIEVTFFDGELYAVSLVKRQPL